MKTSCALLVHFTTLLLVVACLADETIKSPLVEANARGGKKVSLTFVYPEKIKLDEFMRSNRLMAGMWLAERPVQREGGKLGDFRMVTRETDTHWIADVHYPIFNYRGVRLYMIDGVKIRKTPAIQALPAKKKEALLKILRTRGDLILKETGNAREYDVVAFHDGVEKVFSVFTLNKKWMFKDFGKPNLVTIQLDRSGRIRIGGQLIPFDEVVNKVHGLFPTKVIVRASKEVPHAKISGLLKAISNSYFFDVVLTNDGD